MVSSPDSSTFRKTASAAADSASPQICCCLTKLERPPSAIDVGVNCICGWFVSNGMLQLRRSLQNTSHGSRGSKRMCAFKTSVKFVAKKQLLKPHINAQQPSLCGGETPGKSPGVQVGIGASWVTTGGGSLEASMTLEASQPALHAENPSSKCSFFQMGTERLIVSMM